MTVPNSSSSSDDEMDIYRSTRTTLRRHTHNLLSNNIQPLLRNCDSYLEWYSAFVTSHTLAHTHQYSPSVLLYDPTLSQMDTSSTIMYSSQGNREPLDGSLCPLEYAHVFLYPLLCNTRMIACMMNATKKKENGKIPSMKSMKTLIKNRQYIMEDLIRKNIKASDTRFAMVKNAGKRNKLKVQHNAKTHTCMHKDAMQETRMSKQFQAKEQSSSPTLASKLLKLSVTSTSLLSNRSRFMFAHINNKKSAQIHMSEKEREVESKIALPTAAVPEEKALPSVPVVITTPLFLLRKVIRKEDSYGRASVRERQITKRHNKVSDHWTYGRFLVSPQQQQPSLLPHTGLPSIGNTTLNHTNSFPSNCSVGKVSLSLLPYFSEEPHHHRPLSHSARVPLLLVSSPPLSHLNQTQTYIFSNRKYPKVEKYKINKAYLHLKDSPASKNKEKKKAHTLVHLLQRPAKKTHKPHQNGVPLTTYREESRGEPGIHHPAFATIPSTKFSCKDTYQAGMYSDVEAGCQVWHICEANGHQHSFLCPNGTLFNQQLLTCDWWYNVHCSKTDMFQKKPIHNKVSKIKEKTAKLAFTTTHKAIELHSLPPSTTHAVPAALTHKLSTSSLVEFEPYYQDSYPMFHLWKTQTSQTKKI